MTQNYLYDNRKYGLDDNTVDFIGHALALHRDENYLDDPAIDFVKRIKVFNCFILCLFFYDFIMFISRDTLFSDLSVSISYMSHREHICNF